MNKKLIQPVICLLILAAQACSNSVESTAEVSVTSTPTIPSSNYTPTPTFDQDQITATSIATSTTTPYRWVQLNSGTDFIREIISAIIVDPRDPNILYLGTFNSGVYKSIDGGASWQPSNKGLRHGEIYNMAIDHQDTNTIYATGPTSGLHISHDGGVTWEYQSITGDPTTLACIPTTISIDPNDQKHLLWSGGCTIIYDSNDGGETWSPIPSHEREGTKCPRRAHVMIHPENGEIYLALEWNRSKCPGGLYISTDRGTTWELTEVTGPWFWQNQFAVLSTTNDSYVLAIAGNESLFVSPDNGESWKQPLATRCSKVATGSNQAYATCGKKLYRSINGDTWVSQGFLPTDSYQVLTISPHDPQTIYIGGRGLYISRDGGVTWKEQTDGLPITPLGLLPSHSDPQSFYGFSYGPAGGWLSPLYQTNDGGSHWNLLTDQGFDVSFDSTGQNIYRSFYSNNGKFYAWTTHDSGKNWGQLALPFGDRIDAGSNLNIIAHPSVPGRIYAILGADSPPFLYLSSDSGKTWTEVLELEKYPGLLYFAEGSDMVLSVGDGMAKSMDNGETWSICPDMDPLLSFDLSWNNQIVVFDPKNSEKVFLATEGSGILISTNGCQSWETSNNGLTNLFVNTIAIDPNESDIIFAGTDVGAFISTDGGKTWGEINDGLSDVTPVYSIVVDKDSNVYAATSHGIYQLGNK